MTIPDKIITTARRHIEINKTVSIDPQNIALCIDDKGEYRMYDENAWNPPVEQPLLPWNPPKWKPVAIITPDQIKIL